VTPLRAFSFKYDPFGRRIYKSSSAGTSVFAYDGDNIVEETNSSGSAVARYSQGLNIDEPLAMLRSGATSFYHADGLASITSLSSSAGAIAQTYTIDSFGKLTNSNGSLTTRSATPPANRTRKRDYTTTAPDTATRTPDGSPVKTRLDLTAESTFTNTLKAIRSCSQTPRVCHLV
jgi:hypothetical protein